MRLGSIRLDSFHKRHYFFLHLKIIIIFELYENKYFGFIILHFSSHLLLICSNQNKGKDKNLKAKNINFNRLSKSYEFIF